jgi:hypothetical protein
MKRQHSLSSLRKASFMQSHSLNVDPRICMKTAHTFHMSYCGNTKVTLSSFDNSSAIILSRKKEKYKTQHGAWLMVHSVYTRQIYVSAIHETQRHWGMENRRKSTEKCRMIEKSRNPFLIHVLLWEKITLYYMTLNLIEIIKRGGHFQHLA